MAKGGVRHIVTIDDYFPCSVTGGPIFSRSSEPTELWVMILEKAYAKLHGSYYTLRGGFALEVLMDLTGAPGECFYTDDATYRRAVADGEMFDQLVKRFKKGFILSATCPGEEMWAIKN
jgi:calpain-15